MHLGDEAIFALDIGTRTVIGIVAVPAGDGLRIVAQDVVEHASRAMYDGQIHDIPRVADAVARVKARLEEALEAKLCRVAVAAAGRALQTTRARAEQEVDPYRAIDEVTVRSLEMQALAAARGEISRQDRGQGRFYCVGHNVVTYTLDGLPVSNLLDHRGRTIGVEIIATFLPATVVDSLLAVLRRVGLEPLNLTLEPIAAIEVAIPEGMRLLNLALVDIGAGTSDIAVTREGAVIAYGMVPIAGDEITEAIVEACLVDFDGAEAIKRRLGAADEISYTDVLGNPNTIRREELLSAIEPALNHLASEVAAAIKALNGGSPRSVLLVGGGAQVPTLTARIAERLGLSPRLVGIKDRRMIRDLVAPENDPVAGPEGVTVVGIAAVTLKRRGYTFLNVKVNGTPCRIFNSGELTVADCLSFTDFNPRLLLPRNGRDLRFNLNGRPEILRGELGRAAQVTVNGQPAHLKTPVAEGDEILVTPAQNGRDARAFVRDYLPAGGEIRIYLDDRMLTLEPICTLNDAPATPETEIHDDDHLWIDTQWTVAKLARREGLDLAGRQVLVNGEPVSGDYVLTDGDRVTLAPPGVAVDTRREVRGISVTVNGRPVVLEGCQEPILVDIFNFVDFDLLQRQGNPRILLNGKDAAYTDPLKDGDVIELTWEEQLR